MRLSRNFTLEEFARSETADRLGIANAPNAEQLRHLTATALGMEMVRRALGNKPVYVTSGLRVEELNLAIGGVSDSDHVRGWACDFQCAAFGNPYQVCKAIERANLAFDQLIHEKRQWVHISFNPRMRQQRLTLPPDGGDYRLGIIQ